MNRASHVTCSRELSNIFFSVTLFIYVGRFKIPDDNRSIESRSLWDRQIFFSHSQMFTFAPFIRDATAFSINLTEASYHVCSRTAARFSRVRHHDTHDAANGGGGEEIAGVQQCAERHQSRRLGLCYGGRHVLRGFRQLVRAQRFPPLWLERGEYSVRNRQSLTKRRTYRSSA